MCSGVGLEEDGLVGPGRVSRTAAAACTSDVPVGGIRVVESIIREQNAEDWVGV